MKVGDRVVAQRFFGTIVEKDEIFTNKFPVLTTRQGEYFCVKFDGVGPYGNGMGVYHRSTMLLRKVIEKKEK